MPQFSRKMILYLLTKFGIRKPWTNIQSVEDSIQLFDRLQNNFMGNSNIGRKFLEGFKVCLAFPENWFWVLFREKWLCICWGSFVFWSTAPILNCSEDSIDACGRIYRKLQHEEKFSRFCLVFGKMALYLLTKLYIFEPCTNIRSLRRLDLGFD